MERDSIGYAKDSILKKAEEDDNKDLMIIYGEALRKVTMNCVDVAKTVLGVEEIVNGKKITGALN